MEIAFNRGPHGSLEGQFAEIFRDSSSCLLLDPRLAQKVREELLEVVSTLHFKSQTVWIASSGTTQKVDAFPKLVALPWTALRASAAAVNQHLAVGDKDVWVLALPDFHVGGFGIRVRASLSGIPVASAPGNLCSWEVHGFLHALNQSGATLTSLVPAQLFDLVQAGIQAPDTLRAVIVGGQALSPLLYEKARGLGWPVLPSYGMTETSSQVATASLQTLSEPGMPSLSVLPHAQIQRADNGLLSVRASSLLDGVLHKDSGGWSFFDPKVEGVFLTSDRGEVKHGTVRVIGRESDQVKIGGELVDRSLLEQLLVEVRLELKLRSDCALVVEPDERLGGVVALRVINGPEGKILMEEFNRRVLPAGRIRSLRPTREIVRDALGKRAKPE